MSVAPLAVRRTEPAGAPLRVPQVDVPDTDIDERANRAMPHFLQRKCERCTAEEEPLSPIQRQSDAQAPRGFPAFLRRRSASGILPQPRCACGSTRASASEECAGCRSALPLQARLGVGASDDPLEQEADRVADQVLAAGNGVPAHAAAPQIQRFPRSDGGVVGTAPASVTGVLANPGRPLDAALRHDMERRFGADLSGVRVHTDALAERSAQDVNAQAYTVGRNIVFGAGRFAPAMHEGRRLLAHELTHVLQQSAIAGPTSPPASALQRKPAGGGAKTPVYIKEVLVDQNSKQRVTATYTDGSTFSDECSTGKGHCCFDAKAGAGEGGVCSESRSKEYGNNCTPIGTWTVTRKIGSGPVPYWTQFHDNKSVALHEYTPVNGEALSHGCVRLHANTAKRIFDGAVANATRVKVQGMARPDCSSTVLQKEWSGDFATAGRKPPDGAMTSPRTSRRYTKDEILADTRPIREERRALRSALDTDDKGLDAEVAAVAGGAAVEPKIPRCVPSANVEEQLLLAAYAPGFLDAGIEKKTAAFSKALKGTFSTAGAETVVRKFGEQLWKDAAASARGGGAGSDDRQIYWTRLMFTATLRQWAPLWPKHADDVRRVHQRLLQLLEQTSRGMSSAAFDTKSGHKRILVSGFDPFGFFNAGGDIRQGNLSGAAALALDGQTLSDGKTTAEIQSVIYPVRYADFDAGIVENFLRPHLTGAHPPHLVLSISQGDTGFELEEFAGRRRSAETFRDNLGRVGGGSPTAPVVAPGLGTGSEFLPTTLSPAALKAMRGTLGRDAAIAAETDVQVLQPGATQPSTLSGGPGATKGVAVEGSGGGFLSNEVFYRNRLLGDATNSKVPMIHLHTPKLGPGAADSTRNTLIETIRKILRAALAGI